MYQQETITKELHLQLSDEDLAQFELDAKETERLGHIGTHMDCYMEAPRYKDCLLYTSPSPRDCS